MGAHTESGNEVLVRDHLRRLIDMGEYDPSILTDEFRVHANDHNPRTYAEEAAAIDALRSAIPDLEMTIHQVVCSDHRVGISWRVWGTHRQEFEGVPPTNETVAFPTISHYRLEDGRLAEAWHIADFSQLFDQHIGDA